MKVAIVGSRTFDNMLTVEDVDIAVKQSGFIITEVVCGECRGPDSLGRAWAELHDILVVSFEPKWDDVTNCKTVKKNKWGKLYNYMAGFERNQDMANYATHCIAFWDNFSSGTDDMVKRMRKLGKDVYFHKPDIEFVC